jgi:hypothetical protein
MQPPASPSLMKIVRGTRVGCRCSSRRAGRGARAVAALIVYVRLVRVIMGAGALAGLGRLEVGEG